MSSLPAGRERLRGRADAELLAAVAKGDLTALGDLYDRYHEDVARLLRRLTGGSADVDDLVQATFLQLPKVAASFSHDGSCRPWLCGIAVRLAHRQRRGAGRFLRVLSAFAETARDSLSSNPESEAAGRQELVIFDRALSRLSAKKRDTFVLVEIEGLAVDEAARALGIPPETVRTRLFHARVALRAAMKRGGAW